MSRERERKDTARHLKSVEAKISQGQQRHRERLGAKSGVASSHVEHVLSTYHNYMQMMATSFDFKVDRMLKKARTIEEKTENKQRDLGRASERQRLLNESRFETFKV